MSDNRISSAVSIIMPTYNRAGIIPETIESVRSQTFKSWELIIIDDGSDDDTDERIARINDDRIQFHRIKRTGKISLLRKVGIEKAKAEFIAFIDSDDLWDPVKLEKQVAALEENPEAGFCLTNGYNFQQRDIPVDHFYKQQEGTAQGWFFLSFFRSQLAGYIQALMFRRSCLTQTAPFLETDNDVDFIVRLAKNYQGILLYQPLLFRRLHPASYSHTNWKTNYAKGIAVLQAYRKDLERDTVKDAFFRLYLNWGEDCLRNREHSHAARNFLKAWKYHPLHLIPYKKGAKLLLTIMKTLPSVHSRPWPGYFAPKKILAIRLQAMGDLVITLPYLQQLKKSLPASSMLHLLTRQEVEEIPKNIDLFDKIFSLAGGRNLKKQLVCTALLLPRLWLQRYDVVIDLQGNIISKSVRKALLPKAWSVFDRFSPISSGECTRRAIEAISLGKCFADTGGFAFKNKAAVQDLLKANGWDGSSKLVVLNPAGAFVTRNWPIENYVEFARLWLQRFPRHQFLIMGLNTLAEKAFFLKSALGNKLIDLVNKTSPSQAFAVIQKTSFVLSEDSGLMHMAWVSGIPTLAMFGSTRAIRSRPLGDHTMLLDSSDLSCGNCMQEACKYLDTHCLTRYTPALVFEKALALLKLIRAGQTTKQLI